MLARSSTRRLAACSPLHPHNLQTRFFAARNQFRLQSSSSSSPSSHQQQSSSGALAGGVIGGSLALMGFYAWYHFSGAKRTLDTANSAISSFTSAKQSFVKSAPEPNEA